MKPQKGFAFCVGIYYNRGQQVKFEKEGRNYGVTREKNRLSG